MDVCIYYQEWDGKNGSHDLLALAVQRYLTAQGKACPGNLSVCRAGKFGKPYIEELPDLKFSISHSGPWWCCAISEAEVGLDIQELHTQNQEKLARRFFHPEEVTWLEVNGFDQFSRLWAYKESYVKYTGVGLVEGMDYFSVVQSGQKHLGADGLYQVEVPFQQDFWMVLTTKEIAGICEMEHV